MTGFTMPYDFNELSAEGQRVVSVYMLHNPVGKSCNCEDCKAVRRAGLMPIPARPVCCGSEMVWQGDPVVGPLGYHCSVCGERA